MSTHLNRIGIAFTCVAATLMLPASARALPIFAGVGAAVAPATATEPPSDIVFRDDFESRKSGWEVAEVQGWTSAYEAGRYLIRAHEGASNHYTFGSIAMKRAANVRIDMDVSLMGNYGAALVQCYDSNPYDQPGGSGEVIAVARELPHIYVGMNEAAYSMYVSLDGVRTQLGSARIPSEKAWLAGPNRMTVICTGEPGQPGRVQLLLNGNTIADVAVATMPPLGFTVPGFEAFRGAPYDTGAAIDNLVIRRVG